MTKERRQYPRFSVMGMVKYEGSAGISCTEIEDISRGGVRLIITGQEKPGTKIKMSVTFAGSDEVVNVPGQIVWARNKEPYEIGVRFLKLEEKHIQLLDRVLDPD